MSVDFYGLQDDIAALERSLAAPLPPDAPMAKHLDTVPLLTALAWYLRQRDTNRALALVDQAESLLSQGKAERRWPDVSGRLSLIRGETARLYGRFDEAQYYFEFGLDQFRLLDDGIGIGDSLLLLAGIQGDKGNLSNQFALLADALLSYRSCNAMLHVALTQAAHHLASAITGTPVDDQPAMPSPPPPEELIDPTQHPALAAASLARYAYVCFIQGYPRHAAELALEAYPLCEACGRFRLAIGMAALAAEAYAAMGNGVEATLWMENALTLAQKMGWPWGIAVATIRAACVLNRLSLPDTALDLLIETTSTIDLLGASRLGSLAHCVHGTSLIAVGADEEALTHYQKALAWADSHDEPTLVSMALIGQANCALARQDQAAARDLAVRALNHTPDVPSPPTRRDALEILLNAGKQVVGTIEYQRCCRDATSLMSTYPDLPPPFSTLTALAAEAAEQGDFHKAYQLERKAGLLRKKLEQGRTRGKAATLSTRQQRQQARQETDGLRHRVSMESARADALSGMVRTLERLSSIGQDIVAHLNGPAILKTLEQCGRSLLGPNSHYAVYTTPSADQPLRLMSADMETIAPKAVPLDEALEQVVRDRFETIHDSPDDVISGMMLAPMISEDRCRGVLQVWTDQPFDTHRRALVRSLALFTSNALVNAERTDALGQANATLERIAHFDALTDLPNRRHFTDTATTEFGRAQRYRRSLGVLMMDIDFFKSINDTHGHAAGDMVLKEVAHALSRAIRPGDMVGRLGGEEFAALLPDCPASHMMTLAERLRSVVEALPITHDGITLSVTMSVGTSEVHLDDDASFEQALQRADEALYDAKRGGRNRVEHRL